MLFRAINIGASTSTKDLFQNVSFVMNEGERFGLVGPNGCGKSTLLKIILREIAPDTGIVTASPSLTVSYMPQWVTDTYASECVARLASAYEEPNLEYEYFSEIMTNLSLWEIISSESPVLSGGQKTKVALACALAFSANLLILDEPTNFVDLKSMLWLEDFLNRIDTAILTVSHDRAYLDNVVDGILNLTHAGINYYSGGYTDFVESLEHETERQAELYASQKAFKERLEADIHETKQQALRTEKSTHDDSTRRYAKKVAKKAVSRENRLRKMMDAEGWVDRPGDRPSVRVHFNARVQKGTLLRLEDIRFSYDGATEIIRAADLKIAAGEKVAFLGENGSGKTTLLKLAAGELEPCTGVVWRNEVGVIAHFSQDLTDLNQTLTVLEAAKEGAFATEEEVRRVLAGMLIRKEKMSQKVSSLSQGEKTKLALVRQILKKPDLLILDEFTAHLDLDSIEQVQVAIAEYQGAVLFVTHDRYLLETLVLDRYYMVKEGRVHLLSGGLTEYEELL